MRNSARRECSSSLAGGDSVDGDVEAYKAVRAHELTLNEARAALDLHPAEHAAAAIELLVARLAGDERERTRSVRGTLRVRASTDRA